MFGTNDCRMYVCGHIYRKQFSGYRVIWIGPVCTDGGNHACCVCGGSDHPQYSPPGRIHEFMAYRDYLMWIVPLLLLVPNIGLTITEHLYNGWEKAANLLLPSGAICAVAVRGTHPSRFYRGICLRSSRACCRCHPWCSSVPRACCRRRPNINTLTARLL